MPHTASFLLLAAPLLVMALPARASTVTVDNVAFTYSNSLGTEQNNFSVLDGSVAAFSEQTNTFQLPVTVYPNLDQIGSPNAGQFGTLEDGLVGLTVTDGPLSILLGGVASGFTQRSVEVDQGGVPTGVAVYLKPGTYDLQNPQITIDGGSPVNLNSASFTITQTTTVVPDPVAVTPEPSTFAMLGTGLLGVGGVVRRRRGASVR